MKPTAALLLLLALSIASSTPVIAQRENRSIGENAHEAKVAARQQRKYVKKAAKKQRKAMKKDEKAQRQAAKRQKRRAQ